MISKKPKKVNLKEHGEFNKTFTAVDESDEIELDKQFGHKKVSTNDITGDTIKSRVPNQNYRNNYQKVFKNRKS
jgi:hypothetical protein